VERVQKLAAPISRGRLSSVRTSSSGATTPLYGLNQSGVCNELFHHNGTLMQDLRQHAGVTGRREIGAIIGPCRCSDHSDYYNQCVRIWLWIKMPWPRLTCCARPVKAARPHC